jgi:hypothetical protein
MHLLTNEGTLGWWLGKGVIEIGPGSTGLYIQNVSPLNWMLHGQKREYTFIIKILNSIIYMCCNLSFVLTVLISICKCSRILLPLNLYALM